MFYFFIEIYLGVETIFKYLSVAQMKQQEKEAVAIAVQ